MYKMIYYWNLPSQDKTAMILITKIRTNQKRLIYMKFRKQNNNLSFFPSDFLVNLPSTTLLFMKKMVLYFISHVLLYSVIYFQ